ncbi:MAG: hypothetical protein GJ671_05865 [Alteromonadaceae bacterium]|nr:hypothetical protein [Alteromonadaceae bacterium]
MILYRIEDFKSAPSWIEYISLYAINSTFIIIATYAIMGKISATLGFIAFLLFLIASYIFATIKRVRQERAIQFYCACLKELNVNELKNLAQRYRSTDLELTIIKQQLHVLQTHPTPSEPPVTPIVNV